MNLVYLLTGGNIGDRVANLAAAVIQISKNCGEVLRKSSLYETEAWGMQDQPSFLNQALLIHTQIEPWPLMQNLLRIEELLGRRRAEKYGPRTIDIDILFYNHLILNTENLVLPHPALQNRRFALTCLEEIATSFIHPVFNKSIANLLAECPDTLHVKNYSAALMPG